MIYVATASADSDGGERGVESAGTYMLSGEGRAGEGGPRRFAASEGGWTGGMWVIRIPAGTGTHE